MAVFFHPPLSAATSSARVAPAQLSARWQRTYDFPLALNVDKWWGVVDLALPAFGEFVSLRLSRFFRQVNTTADILARIQELDVCDGSMKHLRGHVIELTSLQVLTIHNFAEGDLELASQLPALREIVLFNGCVSLLDMRNFVAVATLERRVVECGPFAHLAGLVRCTALETVIFFKCSALHNLSLASGLEKLRIFVVIECSVNDVAWISECHLLEVVNLSSCPANYDLALLHGLVHLKVLDISEGNMYSVKELCSCVSLETLNISHCAEISEIAPLSQLRCLKEIKADYTSVSNLGA
ncbi:hypothetical protein ABL78_7635 [Leptomonas seymouri]|uniref:Leucine-rich repeat protein (LRRP) n=1 Tax=Leptomonas seymouri TaxID=5684 RepID=A0A0N1IGY4_LEPSE|nr:hypothetical protein ABL78_7635 [Leptomonas seymouri]|eukprot:KPI83340.1 hypothetical protein ABL78_7635 [Leptomonas seymouri]